MFAVLSIQRRGGGCGEDAIPDVDFTSPFLGPVADSIPCCCDATKWSNVACPRSVSVGARHFGLVMPPNGPTP